MAQTSLTAAQDAQLAASTYCLVFKGIPLETKERETYRMLMTAFEKIMIEINLGRAIIPKSLRRITKRQEDKSNRPPHVRVELSSINHRIMIFDELKKNKRGRRELLIQCCSRYPPLCPKETQCATQDSADC